MIMLEFFSVRKNVHTVKKRNHYCNCYFAKFSRFARIVPSKLRNSYHFWFVDIDTCHPIIIRD